MASTRLKASVANLTPHPVSMFDKEGVLLYELPVDGTQLRLVASMASASSKWEISAVKDAGSDGVDPGLVAEVRNAPEYDDVIGLTEFTEKFGDAAPRISIIVSDMVARFMVTHASRFRGRCRFVLAPDTNPGRGVRGKDGVIIGTKGFLYYGDMSA